MEEILRSGPTEPDDRQVNDPFFDSSEQVFISPLAFLKIWTHVRAFSPGPVFGILYGTFLSEYAVEVVDVVQLPQDVVPYDEFPDTMLKLLSQTIISDEYVVGSYTTNAGLDKEYKFPMMEDYIGDDRRFIHIVLDPFLCYGKVHMYAYRYFDHVAIQRGWTYETTSQVNVSQDQRKDKAMYESGKLYCKIPIRHKYNMLEKNMLRCIGKKHWAHGFALRRFDALSKTNEQTVKEMRCLLDKYKEVIEDENKVQQEDLCRLNVGRPDPKKRLEELLLTLYSSNTLQILGTMVNKIAF